MVKVQANHIDQLLFECENENSSTTSREVFVASLIALISNEDVAAMAISTINQQLQVSTQKDRSMILLENIIYKLPYKVVVENAVFWLNICINIHPNDVKGFKRFTLLDKIIKLANKEHDFNKVFMGQLPKVLDLCISIKNTKLTNSALECLKTCFVSYPGPCSVYKTKLDNYLTQFLCMNGNNYTVKKAGSAFHLLQQIGGAGAEGINYIKNWTNQVNKLCSTLHLFLNEFFRDTMEFGDYQELTNPAFELFDESDSDLLHCRLRNTVIFAKCFFLEAYPVQKSISIQTVLDVIKRGLVVDYTAEKNDENDIRFLANLQLLQVQLLELLHYFILCFQQNLLPFSFTITKLLTDCLIRGHNNKYFKCNKNYQILVNKVFCCWINIVQNKLGSNVHEKVLSHLLLNIAPAKDKVTLRLNTAIIKQKNKAKQKAIREKIIASSNASSHTGPEFNDDDELHAASLVTLKTLLNNVVLDVKLQTWTHLYETVIHQLLQIEEGNTCITYANPKCKALLYEVLIGLFVQPSPLIPPPVEEAITILLRAQSNAANRANDVATICVRGLALLEKLCQPICPTLYLSQSEAAAPGRKRSAEDEAVTEEVLISDSDTVDSSVSPHKKFKILDVQIISPAYKSPVGAAETTPFLDDGTSVMDTIPIEAEVPVTTTISEPTCVDAPEEILTLVEEDVVRPDSIGAISVADSVSSTSFTLELSGNQKDEVSEKSGNISGTVDADDAIMLSSFVDAVNVDE